MPIEAVLFDAGNTLIEIDYAFVADSLTSLGHPRSAAEVRLAEQRARVAVDGLLASGASTESIDLQLAYARAAMADLRIDDIEVLPRLGAAILRYRMERDIWNVPADSAYEVLETLAARGYKLAVVSNATGRIEREIRDRNLHVHLEFVLDSHLVGVQKPDPRIFHMAVERLGVRPDRTVYVGDLFSVDVVGARRAGLQAVLLDPAGAWGHLDCPKVASLRDLPLLLEGFA